MPLLNSLGSALGLGQGPSVFPSIAKSLEEGKLRRGDPRLYKQMQDEEKEKAEQEQYAKAAAIIFEGLKVYGDPQKALQDPTVADAFSFFVKSNDPQRLQSLKSFLDIFKERPKYDKTQTANMRSALGAAERRGMNFPVTEENRELLGTMGYNPLMQSRVAGGVGDFATDLQTGRMMNQEQYIPGIPPKPQGTFYQQDPTGWEEQQRKQAQIRQEYRTPPQTPAQIEAEAAARARGSASGTPPPQPRYQQTWIYNKDGTMRHPARHNPLTGKKEPLTINGKANWQKVPQGQLGQALGRVEETLRKQSGEPAGIQTETLPQGLDEQTIQFNMKKYGKTREEVISKYKEKYGLK